MKCHQTEQSTRDALRRDIHIPRAFTAVLLWAGEILQDFRKPKQALINAFYNMSAKSIRLCGCKGTTKFADLQILSGKSFRSLKSLKGISLFEGVEIREMGHR